MTGVTIELPGGREVEIAPFKFLELEAAADHIDSLTAVVEEAKPYLASGVLPPFKIATRMMREAIEIIAIGAMKVDAALTAEAIGAMVDLSYSQSLQLAAMEILRTSGLAPKGEASAPPKTKTGGAKGSARK